MSGETPGQESQNLSSHGISFERAFKFAGDKVEGDRTIHVFGTVLTTLGLKLDMGMISPEAAKAVIEDLISAINSDPRTKSEDTMGMMKAHWVERFTPESKTPAEIFGPQLGTPENPWNPFTE